MKRYILLLCCISLVYSAQAQDPQLADYYFTNGEFEKAVTLYDQLNKAKGGDFYFVRYIESLRSLNKYDDCEKALTKQLKKEPSKIQYYVTLGDLFDRQGKDEKAKEQFKKAIDKLPADRFTVENLSGAFSSLSKYDLALETYEKGAKLLKNKNIFAYNMADLYRRKEDTKMMIESYLNSLADSPDNLGSIESMLQRYVTKEADLKELQAQLYTKAQDDPKNPVYPEMLIWMFLQNKDYRNAFRQAKSVDKLNDENGGRIFNIANIAEIDKDYDAAIEGFNYILTNKEKSSPYYLMSKQNLLASKRMKLINGFAFSKEELGTVEKEYESFLEEFGKNVNSAHIVMELADLEAFHLKNIDKAVDLLKQVIDFPMLDLHTQAIAKMSLGDFYLVRGDNWESTLLYSQVDKAFKDDTLGHSARFRNAKLSYYTGDFDWAQAQFKVLKTSTSKLIANDALDMSVFIMDNTGLDSNTVAMKMYAEAELLVFQNKYDEAFTKMDSITKVYPKHSLEDDIYYLKAHIYTQKRDYDKSIAAYQFIIDNYKEDIRGDNALFELAEIYENRQINKVKAKELYEKLFTDYSSSILAVEARKRFRILRGDKVQ
jgi:tetratricopeptide (TPR) repeat protein